MFRWIFGVPVSKMDSLDLSHWVGDQDNSKEITANDIIISTVFNPHRHTLDRDQPAWLDRDERKGRKKWTVGARVGHRMPCLCHPDVICYDGVFVLFNKRCEC